MNFNGVTNISYPTKQTILVGSADSALATSGSLVGSGVGLNIADGQLAGMSVARGATRGYGAFLNAADTIATTPAIKILQGTPYSSDVRKVGPFGTSHLPFIESPVINSRYAIAMNAKVASRRIFDSYAIGNVSSNSGAIQSEDLATYTIHIGFEGVKQDYRFGVSGIDALSVRSTMPEFSAVAAYVDNVDYIVQRLATEINYQSRWLQDNIVNASRHPVIALAINSAGGSGTTLTAFAAAANGTAVNVMTTEGSTYPIYVSDEWKATTAAWVASASNNITVDSTIEVIDITTAGTASGKGADVLMLVAIDDPSALVTDTIRERSVRLLVGTEDKLKSDLLTKGNVALGYEGSGSGRAWKLEYDKLAGMERWSQERWGMNTNLIVPPSYIDPTLHYNAVVIRHKDEEYVQYSHTRPMLNETIILTPASQVTGASTSSTLLTSLNAILAPWLNSCTIENGNTVTFV